MNKQILDILEREKAIAFKNSFRFPKGSTSYIKCRTRMELLNKLIKKIEELENQS